MSKPQISPYATMLDTAQARIAELEAANTTLRDQVRTLQGLLQGDKYTATASEVAALDTCRTLREKLRALCACSEEAAEVLTQRSPGLAAALRNSVNVAREGLK